MSMSQTRPAKPGANAQGGLHVFIEDQGFQFCSQRLEDSRRHTAACQLLSHDQPPNARFSIRFVKEYLYAKSVVKPSTSG